MTLPLKAFSGKSSYELFPPEIQEFTFLKTNGYFQHYIKFFIFFYLFVYLYILFDF